MFEHPSVGKTTGDIMPTLSQLLSHHHYVLLVAHHLQCQVNSLACYLPVDHSSFVLLWA